MQSAADPPKKVAQGERPVDGRWRRIPAVADDRERRAARARLSDRGHADDPGRRRRRSSTRRIPNAARLFADYLFSRDGQQLLVDMARMRSVHPDVTTAAGHEAALRDQDDEARHGGPGEGNGGDQEEIRRVFRAVAMTR